MSSRVLALAGLLAASSVSAPAQADLPTVDEILSRYTQALGGAAAVDRVQTRVMHGCYLPTSETPCVPFDVYAKGVGKWKSVMTSPGIVIVERIGNAASAWEQYGDNRREMKPEEQFARALAHDLHLAHHPREHFRSMKLKGREKAQGREVFTVDAEGADGRTTALQFDVQSGLLVRMGDNLFGDYRPVDGVQAPFLAASVKTATRYIFTDVKHNVPLDDAMFSPDKNLPVFQATTEKMRAAALEEAVRGIDVTPAERKVLESLDFFSPHEGRMLFDLIRQRGYKRALEIGTAWGNSAIWMAMALKRNGGKLITIELRPEFAKQAQENFRTAGLGGSIESRVNDALKEIPSVPGEFDLVFMDTGTNLHRKFLEMVYSRVTAGGAIISHNADTFERDQPDFRRAVMENPELETSLILTPGGGMSVSIRRPRA